MKEYKQRPRLVLKTKLNGKNKITATNAWAVAVFRYGVGILLVIPLTRKKVNWKMWRVNWKMWTGNQGKQWQCMERYTLRCGQVVHKEERGTQSSDECGTLR